MRRVTPAQPPVASLLRKMHNADVEGWPARSRPSDQGVMVRLRNGMQFGRQRLMTLLATLGAVLALSSSGCQPLRQASHQGSLHVLIGIPGSEALTTETVGTSLEEFRSLIEGFRELHPEATVTFRILQESQLLAELQRRTAAGLAPDLMLVSAARALQLDQLKLIREVAIRPSELSQLSMEGLSALQLANQSFAGVPFLEEPQIACFNRSRLPAAPATVDELVRLAETTDTSIGLSVDPSQLYWSTGSLGARDAILKALGNEPLSTDDKGKITNWLRWLQALNLQQRVNFFPDRDHQVNQLAHQKVDWIPCRCGNIALLKLHLGNRLGIAPLPSGPGGPSSPITRQLVWTFGLNSTPHQKKLAEDLVHFSITPLAQRSLMISNLDVLPANQRALPKSGESGTLDAMLESQKNGRTSHRFARLMAESEGRIHQVRQILMEVIFQEITPEEGTDRLIQMEED